MTIMFLGDDVVTYPSEYPLYVEPEPFCHKRDYQRDNNEARLYFQWFSTHYVDRLPYLLSYFKETYTSDSAADIQRLGAKVASCIRLDWCTYLPKKPLIARFQGQDVEIPISRTLTPAGISLAIDMGLLVADRLLKIGSPSLRWKLVTKPKSHAYYHSPIITCPYDYEPKSRSIAILGGVIDQGEKIADRWKHIYAECMTLN